MRLSDFYDMTWAEFQIKSFAYGRIQENKWRQVRKISFYSMIGSHLDPKSLPKNEVKWFQIGDDAGFTGASEEQKEASRVQ